MLKGIFFEEFDNSYIPHILSEIYMERVYERFLKGKKDLTILDCGANIGLFTMYAAEFAKQIYSVEPSEQHVKVMKHMLEFNGIANKVNVIQAAISNEDGKTKFYHNTNKTMFSLEKQINDKDEFEEVKTTRLDTLFKQHNIKEVDFMKLDIEGSEFKVVGGEGFENVADKIKCMVVELHNWAGVNPAQMETTLKDYGFTVQHIPAQALLFAAWREDE